MDAPRQRADSILAPPAVPHSDLKKQEVTKPANCALTPSYYRDKFTGMVQKTSKKCRLEALQANRQLEREQAAHQRELAKRRARWLGCGCPDCRPPAQEPSHYCLKISSIRELSYHGHAAFDIAEWAVSSFTGPDLLPAQEQALSKWSALTKAVDLKIRKSLSRATIMEAMEIFNVLFFRDHLPPTKLRFTRADCHSLKCLGCAVPSKYEVERETVILFMANHGLWAERIKVLQVVLHEMAHAFFARYTCNPWHDVRSKSADGTCGASCFTDRGPGGHGRAWQYLAKAIEAFMPRYLDLPGSLHRENGLITDILHGNHMPCEKEIQRLYEFDHDKNLWRHMRRKRDDNFVEKHDDILGCMINDKQRPRVTRRASMRARQPGYPKTWP